MRLQRHFQTSAAIWDNKWHDPEIAIELKKPEEDYGIAQYTPEKAKKLYDEVKKHIGEKAYLYGGGGNEADLCILKDAKLLVNYNDYYKKDIGSVEVTLRALSPEMKDNMFHKTMQTRYLGSWGLAFIDEKPKKEAKRLRA